MADELNSESDNQDRVSRLSTAAPPPVETLPGRRDVMREYEERYGSQKVKDIPRSYSTMRVSDEERLWATVAHASVWITFVTGFMTAGFSVPVSIFVPLVIYFLFRNKSDYVTFHALQAFVIQLLGTVGALALLIIGGVAWFVGLVVALLLMIVLIGFVLAPLWGVVGILLLVTVFLMPFAMLLFGTIAAVQTYNGRDYRYPYIARWVDRQLAGGLLNVA
ncbi:MAG: DUF4870 domain-containing protein [Anaerolineae bacterium]|nr:DUF4870 domain-containing protein [Anaerolineae bacterium]